jgi:hypothetical protein
MSNMFYKRIKTKENLPEVSGYYAVETDVVIGGVYWDNEAKKWSFPDETTQEAPYPNYWLSPFNFNKIKVADVRKWINEYLAEEITLSRLTEIINETITSEK